MNNLDEAICLIRINLLIRHIEYRITYCRLLSKRLILRYDNLRNEKAIYHVGLVRWLVEEYERSCIIRVHEFDKMMYDYK